MTKYSNYCKVLVEEVGLRGGGAVVLWRRLGGWANLRISDDPWRDVNNHFIEGGLAGMDIK